MAVRIVWVGEGCGLAFFGEGAVSTKKLILAAADYAEKRIKQPPPELTLGWQLKNWKTLPEAGGYFDQPLGLMTRIETCLNTFDAFDTRRRMKANDFARDYPSWAEYCFEVDEWEV